MADEKPSLHIDTDWKRQAQEEKRKLAEQEARKAQEAPIPTAAAAPIGLSAAAPPPATRGQQAEFPTADFAALVRSMLTQALYYLGDLNPRGGEPAVNLDMAKHQVDTLGVLEDKTKNNLDDEEKRLLDSALYEARSRFVNVASQFIS